VGLYDGKRVEQYVTGHNIWLLNDTMKEYDVVVTYAGARFDLPVLKRAFHNLALPPIHLDLLPLCQKLGLKGGLKRVEKLLGLPRSPETEGLTGWDAVKLWQQHLAGDSQALPLLLKYNQFDIVNLEGLLNIVLNENLARLTRGFPGLGPAGLAEPHPYFSGGS